MIKYFNDRVAYTFSKIKAKSTAPLAYNYMLKVNNDKEIIPITCEQYKSFDNSEIISNLWEEVKTFFNDGES